MIVLLAACAPAWHQEHWRVTEVRSRIDDRWEFEHNFKSGASHREWLSERGESITTVRDRIVTVSGTELTTDDGWIGDIVDATLSLEFVDAFDYADVNRMADDWSFQYVWQDGSDATLSGDWDEPSDSVDVTGTWIEVLGQRAEEADTWADIEDYDYDEDGQIESYADAWSFEDVINSRTAEDCTEDPCFIAYVETETFHLTWHIEIDPRE